MLAKSSVTEPALADLDKLYVDILGIREKVNKTTISSQINLLLGLEFQIVDGRTKSFLGVTSDNKPIRGQAIKDKYKEDYENQITEAKLEPNKLYETYDKLLKEVKRKTSPFREIGFYRPVGPSKTYNSLEILYRKADPEEKIQILPIDPENKLIAPKYMIPLQSEPLNKAFSEITKAKSERVAALYAGGHLGLEGTSIDIKRILLPIEGLAKYRPGKVA